jgi:sulfatase modifying factor 1
MYKHFFLIIGTGLLLLNIACQRNDLYKFVTEPSLQTGYIIPYSLGGVSFNMIAATSSSVGPGISFPTGINDLGTGTITTPFMIAETPVTYELWQAVYTWAASHGYTFANTGVMGSNFGGETVQHPVTSVSWRDSMIWCNALTEYCNAQNGTTFACVYYTDNSYLTPIRSVDNSVLDISPGHEDNPYVNLNAKGFRLVTNNEYEYAARYRGSDSTNAVLNSGIYYTNGNSVSGATAFHDDSSSGSGQPAKSANDSVAVYYEYWDGSSWISTGISGTAAVKSKGANALGLYDMSGNVWQFCYDWYTVDFRRVRRGGSFSSNASYLRVGFFWDYDPFNSSASDVGFRFARNQ